MIDIVEIQIVEQGPAGPAGLYPKAQWDAGLVPYVRATVLSHNGGVWLALRDTSIEPSAAAPDDWAAWLNLGNVATLDGTGKVPAGQLPAIAITDTFAAGSQAEMLALAAQKGDIAVRSDLNKSFVLATDDPSALANWKELLTPPDAILSVAGLTGAIGASALKSALAVSAGEVSGLGAAATLNVGSGLSSGGGNLSANVTNVAGRTGAVTLAQADISGLTTTDAPQFAGLQLSTDLFLKRDAANTLALRNGTNAQRSKWFNTYTDASNGEWFDIDWVTTAGTLTLGTRKNGTGADRPLKFVMGGTAVLDIDTSFGVYAHPNAYLGWTARARMNSLIDGEVAFYNSNSTTMAGLKRKEVRATKTANYALLVSENGTIFDNAGAIGAVDFALPVSNGFMPGQLFSFTVAAAQTLRIVAATGCTIYYGSTASSVAGSISCATIGAHIEIYALDATTWIVKNFTGTWTVA